MYTWCCIQGGVAWDKGMGLVSGGEQGSLALITPCLLRTIR